MKNTLMAATCILSLSSSFAFAQHGGAFGSAFGGAALGGVVGGVLGNALTQPQQPPPPTYYVAPPPVIVERRVYVAPPPVYVAPTQHIIARPWPGPGFACYDPEPNAVNRAICSSQDLSAASLAVSQAVYAAMQQTPYNAGALRSEYAAFLQSERITCAPYGFQQQNDCIAGMLAHERGIMASRLSGVFADEANRPVALHVELQQRLHAMGLLPGIVDGVYGEGTRRAIAMWQSGQGRPATGVLSDDDVAVLMPGYQGATPVLAAPPSAPPSPPMTPPPVQQASAAPMPPPAAPEAASDPLGGLRDNMPYALARPKLFAAGWQTQFFKSDTLSDQDRDARQWFIDHHIGEVEDCSSSGCKMQFHNMDGRLLYVYTQSGSRASDAYRGAGPSVIAFCLDKDDITCPAPSPASPANSQQVAR
ncbi:MAG: peptidoglycan-binding domain-containing protein [Acetobacteraceae bacterium]